jgi:hypothetical protein
MDETLSKQWEKLMTYLLADLSQVEISSISDGAGLVRSS